MDRAVVIPNGIDTERFRPDSALRKRFRKACCLQKEDVAVGIVARLDPMKGYELFARAAAKLLKRYKNLYFFAAGSGDRAIRDRCEKILGQENDKRFIWLGGIKEIETLYNGLDIAVSSSSTEGFSNTIAEAMACGTPCIVTDVGDSAMIVGDTGYVVRPQSVDALLEGIDMMLETDQERLGEKARERIVSRFSLEAMIQATQKEIVTCVALRD